MIKFINNIGDYFSSNYFDEDFAKKVADKSGYASDDLKTFQKRISALKEKYFKFKQTLLEGKLRTRDKINETNRFHTQLLNALGYDGEQVEYSDLFHVDEKTVLPIRHTLYRGEQPHLMIMEMQALIKEGDEEPDGLFEQRYSVEEEETQTPPQKYHRSQWSDLFKVPEGLKISPIVINKVVSQLFLLEAHRRPKYILLCAGNMHYLLEQGKWFRGSYLEFDLESLFDEASIKKDYYSLFYLLLSKAMLAPQAEIVLMEQLDEDSHKSAYEVTQDLKEGVIHAVEAIANEAVYSWKQQGHSLEEIGANVIKNECLNYVYRLLFLFYAESREDLDILPSNDETYLKGYSLEMLRDLEQVPLNTASSQNGHFFHESLIRLFSLLSSGYREKDGDNRSFKIRHLDSPLFNDATLSILPKVKLRNSVWQDVICQLSLSKKQKGKNRGRISYANLGINQLGSVYESLLAFRGFFAETDYIEIHRKRKAKETSQKVVNSDGSYLVPRYRIDDFDPLEVYRDKQDEVRIIPKGTFIYRLSGRDRQKSASYYTPEVLTECTVKYTLKPILERLDKGEMKALDLLDLKILEPAMGAAAFHNEVINQLAEAYLQYRQKELATKVAPDKYREETQKVKAYIALNNVYGVDLNPTAIELGKLSLWLNVIHKDMQTPFFGYRLGTGNAVVGAWLKAYNSKDLLIDPKKPKIKKEWWNKAPTHLSFKPKGIQRKDDDIYHFLLPDKNMVPSARIKLFKDEFPNEAKRVSEWKKDFCAPISGSELPILKRLSAGIDRLLEEHYLHQRKINQLTSGKVALFGIGSPELGLESYQEKERLAEERNKTNAPYFKLKMVMDYWCSLWFWDVRDAVDLPTRNEWWHDLANILEVDLTRDLEPKKETIELKPKNLFERETQLSLYDGSVTEVAEAIIEYGERNSTQLFQTNRLKLVKKHTQNYHFFHYQLEFIEVFKERGGFDVIVGNPPWIVISYDREGLLTDGDPMPLIKNYGTVEMDNHIFDLAQKDSSFKRSYFHHLNEIEGSKSFFSGKANYRLLNGQKPNLYKLVIENSLNLGFQIGIVHDKGVFDDSKGQALRKHLYERLRYYFQFQNELKLFQDVGNTKKFDVTIYGLKSDIGFTSINNLFHPITIVQSFTNKGIEPIGIRDSNGKWNLKGNSTRRLFIKESVLKFYNKMLQDESSWNSTKLPIIHSNLLLESLIKIDNVENKLKDIEKSVESTIMLDETKGKRNGIIIKEPDYVPADQFVLASIHYYDGNPFFQTPNENCSSHRDNSRVDLLTISEDYLPRAIYKLKKHVGFDIPYIDNYYYAQRKRAQISNERTLITSIQPPGRVHTDNTYSIHFKDEFMMLVFASYSFSIIYDFYVKSTGRENIYFDTVSNLPLFKEPCKYILSRSLHLTCLTKDYQELWNSHKSHLPNKDRFSANHPLLEEVKFYNSSQNWNFEISFKSEYARRQALLEIDVLTAMHIGLNLDQLLIIYSVVFGVLQSNEEKKIFDKNGRLVPTKLKDDLIKGSNREDNDILYEGPACAVSRIEDYKVAWAHFENIFKTEELC